MLTRNMKSALFLLLVLCWGAQFLWAQSISTGVVAGTVTDPSGAVVNGATVTLTDIATNTPRTAGTNYASHSVFMNVIPGIYDLTISKPGFATTKAPNLEVRVGQATTFDTAFEVGEFSRLAFSH
jgi:hypothetical protein